MLNELADLTYEKFLALLAEALGVERSDLQDDTSFIDDLGIDSLSLMDFIIKIERRYGIKLEISNIWEYGRVGDAYRKIRQRLCQGRIYRRTKLILSGRPGLDELDLAGWKEQILNAPYQSIEDDMPKCRLRGSYVAYDEDGVSLLGWQRNVARIRGIDVSLPTLITLRLDAGHRIEAATLDGSFRGSKGLMCSRTYLDRNLGRVLVGEKLDQGFRKKIGLANLHCFHLVEVLYGLASFFGYQDNRRREAGSTARVFFEEEGIDSYREGNDLICCGTFALQGRQPLYFVVHFRDIFGKISFTREGSITASAEIEYEYSIDGKKLREGRINLKSYQYLQKHLIEWKSLLMQQLFPAARPSRMVNTNLIPMAFIGLLTQTLAIYYFQNNYDYIMHALTSLQRTPEGPLCIGAVKCREEMKDFFADLSPADLIPQENGRPPGAA